MNHKINNILNKYHQEEITAYKKNNCGKFIYTKIPFSAGYIKRKRATHGKEIGGCISYIMKRHCGRGSDGCISYIHEKRERVLEREKI